MVLSLPQMGRASNILVPDTYLRIQDAIDAAVDSDKIMVRSGTYYENINFNGKAITVYSESGSSVTIIDGDANRDGTGDGPVVTFSSGESIGSLLDGFTLQNGFTNKGGGVYCTASSPTIRNCIIENNTGEHGGGVSCNNGSSPEISGCTIRNNTATHSGSGIYCSSSSPTVANCEISNNEATYSGGGIYCLSSSPNISDCVIEYNTTGYSGGGIYCESSSPTITNCTMLNNEAERSGGGISCNISSSPTITSCVIAKNELNYKSNDNLGGSGGGIFCSSSSPTIINCTIASNTASRTGGGIFCRNGSLPTVTNSIIWANTAIVYNEIYPDTLAIVTYSNIKGGYSGEGNINSDPLFTYPENNDYRLQAGSLCIDAATSNPPVPVTDRDGRTRYDDPDMPDTGIGEKGMYYDVGAYEKQRAAAPTPELTVPTLGEWGLTLLTILLFGILRRKALPVGRFILV